MNCSASVSSSSKVVARAVHRRIVATQRRGNVVSTNPAPPSRYVPWRGRRRQQQQRQQLQRRDDEHRRSFGSGGGARGSRGHGWWVNYRAGKGGRHLQGTYWDHPDDVSGDAWNDAVFDGLDATRAYLDVRVEPASAAADGSSRDSSPSSSSFPVHRLELELASEALPIATDNFRKLLTAREDGYRGSTLHRVEKGVGLLGGLVAEKNPHGARSGDAAAAAAAAGIPRTKRYMGKCHPDHRMTGASTSPTAMDVTREKLVVRHRAGVLTMLQPRVGEIDSRFLLLSHDAPHLDGIAIAIGRLADDGSLSKLREWESTLLTSHGVPTNVALSIARCGLLHPPDEPPSKQEEEEEENDDDDDATKAA